MDIPIECVEFAGRGLTVRTGGVFTGPHVLIDGARADGKRLAYTLTDNDGQPIDLRLRLRFLDPIPRLEIGGQVVDLAPPLAWYEYVWMGIPILLIFQGGCLGGGVGFLAAHLSAHIFRNQTGAAAKYGLSGLVSLCSLVAFVVLAVIVAVVVELVAPS